MAKYSREQRDRAVDLYIKYERCAADVIRELGYPSKGVLLSWYADRLEEERTGVPSGRGERYRRYTDGQKRAAVDHYLEYGRRLSRTMRMLGYPKSKELLMAWIDELAPGQRKLRHGPVPEELKREAVVAVASGRLKSREAAAELGVQDATVREWKRQMLAKSEEATVSGSGKRRTVVESKEPSVKPTGLRTRRTRPVRRMRWRRWRGKWRSSRPVWTSWTPMSNGNDGRRGNSTSRSRSGRARWSCWEKSRAQTRKT